MRRVPLIQRSKVHDQQLLLIAARSVGPAGEDLAAFEITYRLIGLLNRDRRGEVIPDEGAVVQESFLNEVMLNEADWVEMCRKFRACRWATSGIIDDVMGFKAVLLEAEQIKVSEKPRLLKTGDESQ